MTARIPKGEANLVEVATRINAPQSTVFRYFSDSARFSSWIGAPVSFHGDSGNAVAIGSTFRIQFSHGRTIVEGSVLDLVPDKRVQLSWGIARGDQAAEMPARSTTVTIDLEPDGLGTRVRLRHENLTSEDLRGDHRDGWTDYLRVLKTSAEQ